MTIRSGSSNNGIIHFADATSGGGEYVGAILYSHGSNFMRFDTNGSERMRLGSDGFVGIGVTGEVSASTGGASFNVSSDNRRKLALVQLVLQGEGCFCFLIVMAKWVVYLQAVQAQHIIQVLIID